jgi:RHS repeat-associated protein
LIQIEQEQITLNLRLPGQYEDQESGTYYNYHRDYDPNTGRYLTSDPLGMHAGLNSYAYVSGNPLSYIDPLGLHRLVIGIESPPASAVDAHDVLNIDGGRDTGHTFIYAVDNNGIITHAISFGPDGGVSKELAFILGAQPGTADWILYGNAQMFEFDITELQYHLGTVRMDMFRNDVPNYTPITHCTTTAIDVAEGLLLGFNLDLPSGRGPVRIDASSDPLPVDLTNPYHFYTALVSAGHTSRVLDTALLTNSSDILEPGIRDPLLGPNVPPVGGADSTSTHIEEAVRIAVLDNDTDPDGGDIEVGSFDVTSMNGGTIERSMLWSSSLVYTPPAGFTGTDTFTYTLNDGSGGSTVVTVTVDVLPRSTVEVSGP